MNIQSYTKEVELREYCWNTDSWNRNDLKTSRNHTDLLGAYLYTPEETLQEFQRQHKQKIHRRDRPCAEEPPSSRAVLQRVGGKAYYGFLFQLCGGTRLLALSQSPAGRLRELFGKPGMLLMAGCHDAISAKQVEWAGFSATFMSGFAVAATRLGLPDTGLISYAELVDQGRSICQAVDIPVFGDGDTGFGNAINVKRTVQGYAQAGFACIMLEDQVSPKRCGHTQGKAVVGREEALSRIKAAVDARDAGADILIMARTDARATHGLEEAIERCRLFRDIGADISFLEAPESRDEMRRYCEAVEGPKMVNLIEQGKTPLLPLNELETLGYHIAVHPLTLLNASICAMREALVSLQAGQQPQNLLGFEELKTAVGFPEYYAEEQRYLPD